MATGPAITVDVDGRTEKPGGRPAVRGGLALGLPVLAWMGFFFAVPYFMLFLQSFWTPTAFGVDHTWTIDNYKEVFGASSLVGDIYIPTLLRSIKVGALVTLFSTLLAFPVAYMLAFKVRRTRNRMLLYTLVVVPLWASYLLRAYAWKVILGQHGLFSSVLDTLGLSGTFLSDLLYSEAAVVIAMTHIFTPFMILSIYAVLERLPHNLIEASKDLGVSSFATFRKIVLPLSLPGVVAGATFTMGLSSGDFVAPMLVGGESDVMIANQIYSQFGATNNWPLGSAIAFVLLAFVAVLVWISTAAEKREQI
ncbi:MAG: ABC transporter permease [Solirubrobacterales bacterium]|nr:ABC transporter permease [Solirubrobacterales bacterium]